MSIDDHTAMTRDEMREAMSEAVAEGIRAAVSDPDLWTAAGAAMQARAVKTAGGWLFGGIKHAISKSMWVVVFMLAIYTVGGWTALTAALKALSGGHTP